MRISILVFCILLSGCGGRVAKPIALTQTYDSKLTCDHIAAERSNNLARVTELTGERGDKVRDNLGLLISSPFFLDLSQSQKQEIGAIDARNRRLDELAATQNCQAPAPSEAPLKATAVVQTAG